MVPLLMTPAEAGDFAHSNSPYLSPAEFVRLSGLSHATVRRYLDDGRLPKVQPGGYRCRVLIPRDALESLKQAGTSPSSSPPSDSQKSKTSTKSPQRCGPAPRWMGRR